MYSTITLLLAGAVAALATPRAPDVNVLRVVARDYAFELPDTVAAGRTEVRLSNKGKELHHFAIVRLDAGKTANDLFSTLRKGGMLPAWAREVGGPNSPVPGGESAAVVDFKPGTYVAVCVIPSPDGKPHIMKGMAKPFTVVSRKAAAKAAARTPDVKVTLNDYGFTFSRPLTAGRHTLRITNAAAQAHEIFITRLAPGKTAEQLMAWIEKQDGPPPGMPLGGTVGLATGESNDVTVDLEPGEYGLFCFLPDVKDRKPHVAHGMFKQITVR